ncbi:MAG: hypothetical protein ACE5J3_01725 [Methanosarcinales archaeon]
MQKTVEEKIKKWELEIKELKEKIPKLKDSVEIGHAIGKIGSLEYFIWFEKEKERLNQTSHQIEESMD